MSSSSKYYDPCSYSNPDLFIIDHVSLKWQVDFNSHVLVANAVLNMQLSPNAKLTDNDRLIVINSLKAIFMFKSNQNELMKIL